LIQKPLRYHLLLFIVLPKELAEGYNDAIVCTAKLAGKYPMPLWRCDCVVSIYISGKPKINGVAQRFVNFTHKAYGPSMQHRESEKNHPAEKERT
jgi:hypothetical protein